MLKGIELGSIDRKIWAEELAEFVPEKVFDSHTHLWDERFKGRLSGPAKGLRTEVDLSGLSKASKKLLPGRELHFLVLGTPVKGMDVKGHNSWLAQQVAKDKLSQVNILVTPEMKPAELKESVDRCSALGLKPYRSFAKDMTNCRIRDFFPEKLIEVANDLGLAITLHMSRKTGPADRYNLKDLTRYSAKYPRIQWILAHCARGFNSYFLKQGLPVLKDLPNLWYDTSAINDLYSHILLLKEENRQRILYGSDNVVVGCSRGKYISYSHAWVDYKGEKKLEHCDPTPTFVLYEQLRQMKQAADLLALTKTEIQDIFWNNSQRLIKKCITGK